MAKLSAYRQKRNFSETPEPSGAAAVADGNVFVIHKHSATADHYDLRLQVGGVLKSWAVPKGPSLNPADKRLAVQTEDHPLEYADFEGVIPEGQYGGGPMILWDRGTWAPMEDVETGLEKGAFKFRLAGEKLIGGWMLARLKGKPGDKGKVNWLLFKERDLAADAKRDIIAEQPESVKSGLTTEQLLAQSKKVNPAKPAKAVKPADLKPGALAGAKKAKMPAHIDPQLASPADKAPAGDDWLHEIKFDGYRTQAYVSEGTVRLVTRSGLDWTHRYGDLADAFKLLPCREAIIDGEIVVTDDQGIARFELLQDALTTGPHGRLVFFAFDLVHLDGYDLSKAPLVKRKDLLAKLLAIPTRSNFAIQLSDHVIGGGAAMFERASEMGVEGIVSKRADAPYKSGRSSAWLKLKAQKVGDFIIAGYTTSPQAEGLAALGLAQRVDGELRYCGKVGTGWDSALAHTLLQKVGPLAGGAATLDDMPKGMVPVRPVLSAHIHYSNLTGEGYVRHAVFKSLREPEVSAGAAPAKKLISEADLATIWVTNPERRLFGKTGPTKLDIAVYYAHVGNYMLPHILERPVSLVRCPTARPQDCFFQRHAFSGMPPSVATIETENSEGEEKSYISVEDAKAYLALAQFGVVEFHTWGSTRKKLDKPDRLVFDLDPGEGINWREVVEAAVHVKAELERLKLVPFVKTSGGRGIHIVVPVKPTLNWKQAHKATSDIAERIAKKDPAVFTAVMGKANRKKRIFIDFHRNARSATSAAAYSLRARPGLTASTPLSWADLESIDAPEDLNYSSLPALLAVSGDPWAEINGSARTLTVK
ncbi:MAG TPA: DNA ligase D [Rhizobiaceae bacterium]|nr:DNA ligase D [Rhizobiaceae bacterium]